MKKKKDKRIVILATSLYALIFTMGFRAGLIFQRDLAPSPFIVNIITMFSFVVAAFFFFSSYVVWMGQK